MGFKPGEKPNINVRAIGSIRAGVWEREKAKALKKSRISETIGAIADLLMINQLEGVGTTWLDFAESSDTSGSPAPVFANPCLSRARWLFVGQEVSPVLKTSECE